MTHDPTIQEQSHRYFLQEAPELLQVIEQELFTLREDFSVNKVYTLMRATHTLKGAAASICLETITTVAHTLEDVFRAICKPDLSIDQEVEALLVESYECLRLLLTAELTGGSIDDNDILDRIARIFAQLQEKLGDCFAEEAYLPDSQELGFDLTQSIFEVGVTQRLEELATTISSGHPEQVATTLRVQAEIFFGLAESLNLPGFKAIAQTALTALDNYPEQAMVVGYVALANFQEARKAVLNGDRSQGGEVSLALQKLGERLHDVPQVSKNAPVKAQESVRQRERGGFPKTNPGKVTQTTPDTESDTEESANDHLTTHQPDSFAPSAVEFGAKESEEVTLTEEQEPVRTSPHLLISSPPQPAISSSTRTVRVNVGELEQLNYHVGELLTNQNRQFLQNEQQLTVVRVLLLKLQQHQQLLHQLQDLSQRQFSVPEQQWLFRNGQDKGYFDSLELTTSYTEFHHLVQSLLEDMVQLGETTDAIEMFTRQSQETLEKQRRLLTHTHDSLMEARMLPLGHLFERFPRILHQLEVIHKKQVTLNFRGSDTLVDKAVVEKLYDPLLHLLRNAFDHGIELNSIRQKRGKPEKGQIEISAYQQGKYLVIEVRDDGQGLDFETIRAKAVERQLVSPEQASNLNEAQLTEFIFQPGFSTASNINDLSGRGIGLDVVRIHLQTIKGSVEIYSQFSQGTMFRLQVPLSLTIANLLLCQAGNQIYALFTNSIEEILIPKADQIRSWEEGKVLQWSQDGLMKLIPCYQLTKVLNYFSSVTQPSVFSTKSNGISHKQEKPIILIRSQDKLFGLEVDQLIGDQELVIRPLGAMIVPPPYIYGSSVLPDGRLTLVLDGLALMEYLSKRQKQDDSDWGRNSALWGERHFVSPTPLMFTSRIEQPRLLSQASTARTEAPTLSHHKPRPKKTILVVDDSITVRQTVALTLEKADYQVLQAKDGYEAIELLQGHTDIHLVFCDIEMPRMNGFEFLKNRQQDPALANIPVVMLTSRSSDKHRQLAFKLGANAYITKPYLEHILLTTLRDVFEKDTGVVARRE
ncbi:hybrid sensor histidine kinase/response regulator [Brasilonema bromeliae]|uniref:histidine kinase n=1 Tax=Brasilonema bromeliae SPC951 TaxID=385972 RepID=A0ABX1P8T7_9CYAN|nr:hybrid sensor histidine kinase/response regulator [Brasilonema bromeliae]NMG20766.1 hybrid sensor histidine kinase/response regulator [Brasilonema bromeliae SPC951]